MDFKAEMQIWGIVDPDIARENPVEDKHRRLVRGHRGGPLDRELKPDAKIRDELTVSEGNFLLVYFYKLVVIGHHQLPSNATSQL
jgi:hypothetical protein